MNNITAKFYLLTNEWTGPVDHTTDSADKYGREIIISTEPGRGNMSPYPVIIDGWLGTTNDWRREAHGQFETKGDAFCAAAAQFGPLFPPAIAPDPDAAVVDVLWDRDRTADRWDAADWLADARSEYCALLAAGKTVEALAAEIEADAVHCTDNTPAGVILHGTRDFLQSLVDGDE